MKIVHVIYGLGVGGAERMLERLVLGMQVRQPNVINIIISLSDAGAIGSQLREKGVQVIELRLDSLAALPFTVLRLTKLLRSLSPDIVQSWMYRADFISAMACQFVRRSKLVWGIRCAEVPQNTSLTVKTLIRLNAFLSHLCPDAIICCAEAAKRHHISMGYRIDKMVTIANGIDFDHFRPNHSDRMAQREKLGYDEQDVVIGIVGRFDELKDYGNFIAAGGLASKANKKIKFLMIGRGIDSKNENLTALIRKAGLDQRVTLLGESYQVAALMRAMDIYCLSSRSEGFPNVVVEAMATSLPCIVTDVGDAALIVGDCGVVVPPRDVEKLASEMVHFANLNQSTLFELGRAARIDSQARFSLSAAVTNYTKIYEHLVGQRKRC